MALAEKATSAYCSTGNAEPFGGGLQEITIAGRALRVQPEILDAPILRTDQLDVLPADIDDDVRIRVEVQSRFGVRHGLRQSHVGAEHLLQMSLA